MNQNSTGVFTKIAFIMSPITRSLVAAVIAGTAAMAVPHIAEGAPIIVDQDFWGTPSDVGTMAWAINQANMTFGTDTISITAGLEINVDAASALPGTNTWLARFTESADVQGNGARLVGNPAYITTGGVIATKDNIVANPYSPAIIPGEVIFPPGFNFAQIGTSGDDNSSISVNFTDLGADGLASFAQLHEGAQVSVTGGAFDNMVNYTDIEAAGRPVFQAFTGSTLDLSDISITRSYPFANAVDASLDNALFFGTIQGEDSQLNLENSAIDSDVGAGAVSWNGGTAHIVSSVISDSGGLSIADGATNGVLNFVNSSLYMTGRDDLSQTQRIHAAFGG